MTDRDRFVALCASTYDRVLGYALRRTDDPEDAADVTAEVFVVAWRRFDEVPDGDRAVAWLFGTARRILANHHRGRRRQRRLHARVQSLTAAADAAGADAVVDRVEMGPVAAAFASLRETDREVLRLVGWEGLDRGQLAEALGCGRGAARVRLHRARRRFARALGDRGIDPRTGRPTTTDDVTTDAATMHDATTDDADRVETEDRR